jgi:sulfopyruvate decarboxylase TPP-binding subunit
MLDGPSVVRALKQCGITHVIWVPDSVLGTWEAALTGAGGLPLIRVCREGEAFAIAAGLIIGGKKPIIFLQCTGLFEAGDALRNVAYDLELPVFFLVGVRSYYAHRQGASKDTCPVFTEPIMKAWQVPYTILENTHTAEDLATAYLRAQAEGRPGAVLLAE